MPLFLMQKIQIICIKNEGTVILLIEKVIDNKMFLKSTAGLYISDSYQRNFISHRHRIFYGLKEYSLRYMNKKELKCLTELVTSYTPLYNFGVKPLLSNIEIPRLS